MTAMIVPRSGFLLSRVLSTLLLAQFAVSLSASGGSPRSFDLALTWEDYAPDGFTRKMILTNRQFPSPLLEINEGDSVEVLVHNYLPYNTTIHFHGTFYPLSVMEVKADTARLVIQQYLTPYSDGVPGVSQRPIQPGSSFLYNWTATQSGSYCTCLSLPSRQSSFELGAICSHLQPLIEVARTEDLQSSD